MVSPEARCLQCDEPCADHIAFRYWVKPWWKHTLLRLISKPLNKIQDLSAPF